MTVAEQFGNLLWQPEPCGENYRRQYGKQAVQHLFPAHCAHQQPQGHCRQHQEMDREQRIAEQESLPQLQQVVFHHCQCAALHRRRSDPCTVGHRRRKQNAQCACRRKEKRPQCLFREGFFTDQPIFPYIQHGQPDSHHADLFNRQPGKQCEHAGQYPAAFPGERRTQQHPVFEQQRKRQNIIHRTSDPVNALPRQHRR